MDKVSNRELLDAGLSLMRGAGKPLDKMPTASRAMKYRLANGETVRVRTCNDHVLVVVAESTRKDAALNIEGTDHLLIVMPEVPREPGPVIAYLVPTATAVRSVRKAHSEWLDSNPATKGNNLTWNVWFGEAAKSGGFANKWSQYRLPGRASTLARNSISENTSNEVRPLGLVIVEARKAIAAAAGVSVDAVKITVELN